MIYLNEHQKKLDELYTRLTDLKQAKRLIENCMHQKFYERDEYARLFKKLDKVNYQIKEVKKELEQEKKLYEKSR